MGVWVNLEDDEAVVLFDFLSRCLDEKDGRPLETAIVHDGELWALNGLLTYLEKSLAEPFYPEYDQHVVKSRQGLAERCGPWPTSN